MSFRFLFFHLLLLFVSKCNAESKILYNLEKSDRQDVVLHNSKYKHFQNLIQKYCLDLASASSQTDASSSAPDNDKSKFCPVVFDGLLCWDKTKKNHAASQKCPPYIIGFDHTLTVYKKCTGNGTWQKFPAHPDDTEPWTNYATCVDAKDTRFRKFVYYINMSGYSISLLTLACSVCIFTCFRVHNCVGALVCINFFISLILNNILCIIWHNYVTIDPVTIAFNAQWCQILHILINYFMLTNYAWMFCESLHLHFALAFLYNWTTPGLLPYLCIGWLSPLIISTIYVYTRYYSGESIERCWMEQVYSSWILIGPILIELFISAALAVNVIKILIKTLHRAPCMESAIATRKAARAALMLVPLLGLQFFLIPFRPSPHAPGEYVYVILSTIITSFQGLNISILFCFSNQDVILAYRVCIERIESFEFPRLTRSRRAVVQQVQQNTVNTIQCIEMERTAEHEM